MKRPLRVALVHDYLREYGGAERVLEALHALYPEAPVYTAFVDSTALGMHWQRFSTWDIRQTVAAKIPLISRLYSPLRIFSAFFFETLDLSDYDVVISSTNMYMAKAVLTSPTTLHICYCHTPPRSLYGYSTMSNWKKNPFVRVMGELLNYRMRAVDYVTAQRPDIFVANSQETQRRITKYYRRESTVIYPPVQSFDLVCEKTSYQDQTGYYLYVNRLAYSKHPEIAVTACTNLGVPLKVVGAGAMAEELQKLAGPTVEFCGPVSDCELDQLYTGATALLYPVEDEDFGIVPVEAMMHGVPVIAHNSGGPRETIVDGKTGVLFDQLDTQGMIAAMRRLEGLKLTESAIRSHAQRFSTKVFHQEIERLVQTAYAKKQGGNHA